MKENKKLENLPEQEGNEFKEKEDPKDDITISGYTEVKNAHASGLGSMGRNDEEETGEARTQKD